MNIKELPLKKERIVPGQRLCPGCPASMIARFVLFGTDKDVIIANATGCLEVSTTIYPFTSWNTPYIHNAFENVAATISGVESAYNAMKRKGYNKEVKFLAIGGDGGTFDIGLQSLSGAIERGHKFLYVCYDNEAYENTGIQRSSATPMYASTTTDPFGDKRKAKQENRKDIMKIVIAHDIPYAAQASISNWPDLIKKAEKGFNTDGPAFLNVLSPCIPGWGIKDGDAVKLSKLAVASCYWPLYEYENGKYTLNYDPLDSKLPVIEFLKLQKRFSGILNDSEAINKVQSNIDKKWEELKRNCSVK